VSKLVLSLSLLIAASIAPLALAPTRVAAQDALEEARAAIRAGDPERAIAILEDARARQDDPELDHELYVAHEQAGHRDDAADHLEIYLETAVDLDPALRRELAAHLRDLRQDALGPTVRPGRDDPWIGTLGWAQLGVAIAGAIVFLAGAAVALSQDTARQSACIEDLDRCEPGEPDEVRVSWSVAWTGFGAAVVTGALGVVYLLIADENIGGSTRALPPDLDPTQHRPFVSARDRDMLGEDGVGLGAQLVF
jgi:hypothetical protein